MRNVFLSYSTKDHYFADLAEIKLAEAGIVLWRDRSQLRAGADWQSGIERGIADCFAVLIALSANSAESSYVTYEWAYALGNGKTVIPMKLSECLIHPRLQTIQHLDFSVPGALPWESLVARIREVEVGDGGAKTVMAAVAAVAVTSRRGTAEAAAVAVDPDAVHVKGHSCLSEPAWLPDGQLRKAAHAPGNEAVRQSSSRASSTSIAAFSGARR
jgi:hypothetical protein